MLPERNPIEFFNPKNCQITDVFGENITLSSPTRGSILGQQITSENGDIQSVSFSGNFHANDRQNEINFLQSLDAMQSRSEQEHQELELVCPHPQMFLRGYVGNLQWDHRTTPSPLFFNWSFDFNRSTQKRQPVAMRPLANVLAAEGKPYVIMDVPGAITELRDFVFKYLNRNYDDNLMIQQIIKLNRLKPAQQRSLPSTLKVPLS